MFKTLQAKILFSCIIVSLSGILIVSFAIQWGFEDSFNSYLSQNREEKIDQVLKDLKEEYKISHTFKAETTFSLMHEQAMTDNLYYQVKNKDGEIVIDSTSLKNMMNEMGMGVEQPVKKWGSNSYQLEINHQIIGTVIVYYPSGLVENEYQFLAAIQQYILAAVIITIFIAIIVSMLFSRKITAGLRNVTKATAKLKNQQLDVRIPFENLTGEMKELAISFNNLAESLAKQEMLRKQFTGDLAHELRTPLATLRSQLEAFLDGVFEPTPERLQQFHNELMRLVRLVNELEKLIAAENPQLRLEKVEVDVRDILHFLEEMFQPIFEQKNVKLIVEYPNNRLFFKVDKDKFIQIMTNLLNNALKYTPQSKMVTLSAEKIGKMIGFSIEDQGFGISKEDLPHILERFYRGDKSRNRNSGGIGIGLSIVAALVKAHDGEISITSEVGQGTKVTVLFPIG